MLGLRGTAVSLVFKPESWPYSILDSLTTTPWPQQLAFCAREGFVTIQVQSARRSLALLVKLGTQHHCRHAPTPAALAACSRCGHTCLQPSRNALTCRAKCPGGFGTSAKCNLCLAGAVSCLASATWR